MRYSPPLLAIAVALTLATTLGASGAVAADEPNATFAGQGETVQLEPVANATIEGETTVDPSSSLTINVQSTNDTSPFLTRAEANVSEDGTFTAMVDLTILPTGNGLEITVQYNGTQIAETEGMVVADASGGLTETAAVDDSASANGGIPLGDVAPLALGAVLAVAGIGLLLGYVRD